MRNPQINTVLITGGTGKIGYKLTEGLAGLGYNVIFTSRSEAKITDVEERLGALEGKVKGILLDLESPGLINEMDNQLEQFNMRPAALINNARNISFLKPDEKGYMPFENWIGEFNMAVTVPYLLSMHLAEQFNTPFYKIINIASMYGVVAPNLKLYDQHAAQSPINYGTCKAAMIHLTKELAVRLAHKDIQVNAVSYGGVEGRVNEEFLNRYKQLVPQGRMLAEDELLAPISFLLSENCKPLTGHNLIYDGGWTIW